MSPPPLITPAPSLSARLDPRQNSDDPYGLNSLYAMYSSLLGQYSYSYSEFDYASFYASYLSQYNTKQGGYDELSSLLDQLTATGRVRPTGATGLSRASKPGIDISQTGAASSANSEAPKSGGGGGLSSGAKIGIAVAVPLVLLLLAGVGIFLWCAGKRKGKKSSTTIIAPNVAQVPPPPAQFQPPQFQPQPQGYPPNQGHIAGYQQPQFAPSPPPQFAQGPPQYSQGQGMGQHAMGAYGKGPPEGIAEMETEYHFARGGAVEIGDTEPKAPEKKGPSWRKMVGGAKK